MFDFTKLSRPRSAAERLEDEKRRHEAAVADDHARRTLRSRSTVVITLTDEPETRFTMTGEGALHLRGRRSNGRQTRAVWYAPDHKGRDEFDAVVAALAMGTTLELRGYWKPYEGKSGTHFTFMAQFFTPRQPAVQKRSAAAELAAFG